MSRARISSLGTTCSHVSVAHVADRHQLDEADVPGMVSVKPREVFDLIVVDAAHHDHVQLDRIEARASRRRSADRTGSKSRLRRAILTMRSSRRLSTLMFTRSNPASRSSAPISGSRTPFVDSAMSVISGTARSMRINSWICGRIVGSPPVMRNTPQSERRELSDDFGDFLVRQNLRLRQPLHPVLRHAVHAAEVAAVRDRDAEILDAAAELVAQSRAAEFGVMASAWISAVSGCGVPSHASSSASRPTLDCRRRSARASRSARAA